MLGLLLPLHRANDGALIPIAVSVDTASAFRPSCQAGQQREWSHAWPVDSMP